MGGDSGHRYLQRQEFSASVHCVRQLRSQVQIQFCHIFSGFIEVKYCEIVSGIVIQLRCSVPSSGIVEGDVVLSLQQTVTEPKDVEKENQEIEDEASEGNILKLFKPEGLRCRIRSSELYEQLKEEPEALTVLAPAAGDTIISLDFNNSGAS